jgi:hypothetical protein
MSKILHIFDQNNLAIDSNYEVIHLKAEGEAHLFEDEHLAIILSVSDKSLFTQWVKKIRSDSLNFSSLIYSADKQYSDVAMIDGVLPTNLDIEVERFLVRKAEVKLNSKDNLESKLLTYLWGSEKRNLQPSRVIDGGVSYQYPFLELWDDGQGKEHWLNRMVKSGHLVEEKLIDRIRQCKSCSSALLNYVDSCGDCDSIDLKVEQAIHCFYCGHVADQKEFIRSGEMVCTNCLNTLRHIGSDYDRPIENQRCNSCDNLFIEATVKAQCFSCGNDNKVEELIQKEYFSFLLGHNGIIKVRTGEEPQLLATTLGEPVSREHFSWVLNWLNKMAIRQKEQHLFLAINFCNLAELQKSMSVVALNSQLEAFCEILRNLMRSTDIFSQHNDETIYFLLPHVSSDDISIIENKLNRLSKEQVNNLLHLQISLKQLPDLSLSNDVDFWLSERNQELLN